MGTVESLKTKSQKAQTEKNIDRFRTVWRYF